MKKTPSGEIPALGVSINTPAKTPSAGKIPNQPNNAYIKPFRPAVKLLDEMV
jgi:hypothetical protein